MPPSSLLIGWNQPRSFFPRNTQSSSCLSVECSHTLTIRLGNEQQPAGRSGKTKVQHVIIDEVPLENKTEVVDTEQRFVKLIILKIFPKLYSHEFSSAGKTVDLFTGMRSNLLFNLCK